MMNVNRRPFLLDTADQLRARAKVMRKARTMIELQLAITCRMWVLRKERMPTDACLYLYDCKNCGLQMKPKTGACCVFCSYGSVPCPPVQEQRRQADEARQR